MREIKFRIWDDNNGHYDYPDVVELECGLEYEQFTGLHDKNGVEIYEGDILTDGEDTGNVLFNLDGYEVDFGSSREFLSSAAEDCEVIGNIHETEQGDK
jgi:hypothetical protein